MNMITSTSCIHNVHEQQHNSHHSPVAVGQFIGHWDNTRTSTLMEYCSGREPELITVLHAASNGITAVQLSSMQSSSSLQHTHTNFSWSVSLILRVAPPG